MRIITLASYNNKCDRFLKDFEYYNIIFYVFLPYCIKCSRLKKGQIISISKPYPGHINKYSYIDTSSLEDNEWYLYLDMYDVILQDKIPDLNQYDCDILVASEGMKWNENKFYRGHFEHCKELEILLDKEVFCSGTYAIKGKYFKDLIHYLLANKNKYKGQLNQPLFNMWLQKYKHKDCDIFGTLAYNIDKGIITKKNGKFYKNEKLIPIVHGNGSYIKYLN